MDKIFMTDGTVTGTSPAWPAELSRLDLALQRELPAFEVVGYAVMHTDHRLRVVIRADESVPAFAWARLTGFDVPGLRLGEEVSR